MTSSLPTTGTIADVAAMQRIDEVERRILAIGGEKAENGDSVSFAPVRHHFTPGLYAREIFMPAGSIIVSKIHRTRHPYIVSQGRCFVYMGGERWDAIAAPHFGITEPGTRRILVILDDTIWTTFHVTKLTDVAEIDRELLEQYSNPLLEANA